MHVLHWNNFWLQHNMLRHHVLGQKLHDVVQLETPTGRGQDGAAVVVNRFDNIRGEVHGLHHHLVTGAVYSGGGGGG